jgi:hypothetical protein
LTEKIDFEFFLKKRIVLAVINTIQNFKMGFLGQTALDKNNNFRNDRAKCTDEVPLEERFWQSSGCI